MAERRQINNLIVNGNFNRIPSFTAATTTNNRVVDGTAGGATAGSETIGPSTALKEYKWKFNAYNTTSPSAQYDTEVFTSGSRASMKVTGTAIKERVNLTLGIRAFGDLNQPADIRNNLIPILPNTSYTLSCKIKTDISNATGTPGVYGANLTVVEHSGTGFTVNNYLNGSVNSKIATTTDFTEYTMSFTTAATTKYANIYFGIFGNAGSYADITAWFSDIKLDKTTGSSRATATSRSTSSNRVKVRDMGTALRFDGVDDVVTVKKNSSIDILPDSCSAFTISSIFFYQTSSATDATISRYGKDDSLTDTNSGYWLTIRNTDGLMRLGLGNGSAREYENTINLKPNNWYFMDFVFEDGQVKAYNRGQLVATQTWSLGSSVDFAGSNWFTIGAINSAAIDSEFKGIIKMHRLFDRALTAQESLDQYLNNVRYENVSEYLFNEASGTTALDTSGNGNDGTITGATYTLDVPLQLRDSI
jgi:hypothetical protein